MLRRMRLDSPWLPKILVLLLLACLSLQVGEFILVHSNTADELAYIGSGVAYVRTGKLDMDINEHPPLLKYAIGLALSGISPGFPLDSPAYHRGSYAFGHEFLYRNAEKPETILARARMPTLILSLLLAAFVFAWASWEYGIWGGVLALVAYVFEPNIVANSGLATFDLGLSCFLLIAAFLLARWKKERKPWQIIFSGLAAGCAVTAKIPGLIFYLWAAFLLFYPEEKDGARAKQMDRPAKAMYLVCVMSGLVIAIVYQVRFLPDFLEVLRFRFQQTFTSASDPMLNILPFFHGAIRPGGWRYYFAAAFLIKSTIPFIALCLWAAFSGRPLRAKLNLLFPALTFFLACSLAGKQQGLRYMLPAYPFLCVLIGGLAPAAKKGIKLWIVLTLVIWSAIECLMIRPHYLAYFNELIGGPGHGYLWLGDSNLDWGQDLGKVGAYLRSQGSPAVIVANVVNADRDYYLGKDRQDLIGDPAFQDLYYRHINPLSPPRELLVASASMLQGYQLSDPTVFRWLFQRKPIARIGYTTFVYDITRDPASHFNIGWIYYRIHQYPFALREFRQAQLLAPGDPRPRFGLKKTLAAIKSKAK